MATSDGESVSLRDTEPCLNPLLCVSIRTRVFFAGLASSAEENAIGTTIAASKRHEETSRIFIGRSLNTAEGPGRMRTKRPCRERRSGGSIRSVEQGRHETP